MTNNLKELQERFNVEGSVSVQQEQEGFPFVEMKTEDGASTKIYLYGAHLFSFIEKGGKETIFMSNKVIYKKPKGLRGGIPVCWPQFASEGPLPQHGFCRSSDWTLSSTSATSDKSKAFSIFTFLDSEETRKVWNHNFQLTLTFELSHNSVHLTFEVKNTGSEAFSWSGALHTYFLISDVTQTTVSGLSGITYVDKTKNKQSFLEENEKLGFSGETDRCYYGAGKRHLVVLDGTDDQSHYRVDCTSFDDVVVWNPWSEKAKEIVDFEPSEWKNMICVEGAQLNSVTTQPGQTWTGKYVISKL